MWLVTDDTGQVALITPSTGAVGLISLPSGVTAVSPVERPSFIRYAVRGTDLYASYIAGQFSNVLTWVNSTLYKAGITAASVAPTLSQGSAPGVAGLVFARYTPAQYIGTKLVAEGNPSPASNLVSFTDQKPYLSGIPATFSDTRVTHFNIYLSVDGSLSYRAGKIALGTTDFTFSQSLEYLFQQETLPIKFDADGRPMDDILAYGQPPYATVMLSWHRRAWYVDPTKPGVWMSAIDNPEAVNSDEEQSYIPTLNGEYPLSLGANDDELLVFCEDAQYAIAGFGESSFRMRRLDDSVRFIAPHSVQTIQGMVMFASDQGVMAYMGGGGNSFRNLMARSFRRKWIELYAADTTAFENAASGYDRVNGDYIFLPDYSSGTRSIRGYLRAMLEEGEAEPWWYWGDVRTRRTRALGQFYYPGSRRGLITYGECDGYARWDDEANTDDDGDAYGKKMTVAHKHFFFGDQGGDAAHGRTYTNLNLFARLRNVDATVNFYAGDDTAYEGAATKSLTIEPAQNEPGQTTEPTSYSEWTPEVAGKGLTVEIVMEEPPANAEYRGFSIEHREGPQTRS